MLYLMIFAALLHFFGIFFYFRSRLNMPNPLTDYTFWLLWLISTPIVLSAVFFMIYLLFFDTSQAIEGINSHLL